MELLCFHCAANNWRSMRGQQDPSLTSLCVVHSKVVCVNWIGFFSWPGSRWPVKVGTVTLHQRSI